MPESESRLPEDLKRDLCWPDLCNVRDLGGMTTGDGKQTKYGRLVRAECLGYLNSTGRRALLDYGIRTIIDLRSPWQTVEFPSNVMQPEDGPLIPTYMNISLEALPHDVLHRLEHSGWQPGMPKAGYCEMLDHCQERFRLVMQAIADACPGGVVIHCYAGQDRTGIIAALLLTLTGVPRQHVVDDYVLTHEMLSPQYEKSLRIGENKGGGNVIVKPDAIPESMNRFLDHLESRYGGVTPYLGQIGLSSSTIGRLYERLVV